MSKQRRRFVQVMAQSGRVIVAFQSGEKPQHYTSARTALMCDHRSLLSLKASRGDKGFVFDALTALYAAHHADLQLLQHVLEQSPMLLTSTCNLRSHLPVHLAVLRAYADKGYSAIDVLALKGNNDALQWLIDKGLRITWKAYAAAASGRHIHTLEWLFEHCPLSFAPNNVFEAAARTGDMEILQYLREQGFFCSQRAIDQACVHNHIEAAKWMAETFDAQTSHLAFDHFATEGNLAAVQWIHQDHVGLGSMGAAVGAAANGHLEMLQWLQIHPELVMGYNRSVTSFTPAVLEAAIRTGQIEIVKWLLDMQDNIVDHSTIKLAAGRKNHEMLRMVLAAEPPLRAPQQRAHVVAAAVWADDLEAVGVILAYYDNPTMVLNTIFSPNTKDSQATVLILASTMGSTRMCKLLLEHGADPNIATEFTDVTIQLHTPLMRAADRGYIQIVELLLDHDAKIVPGLLLCAARSKQPEILRLILALGTFDERHQAVDIRAALHYACLHGSEEMVVLLTERFPGMVLGLAEFEAAVRGRNIRLVERLLNAGADANPTTAKPITIACELHDLECVSLLISYGAVLPQEGLRAFVRTTMLGELVFANDNAAKDMRTLLQHLVSSGTRASPEFFANLIESVAIIGRGDVVNAVLRFPGLPTETDLNPMVKNKYLLHVAAMEGWVDVVSFLCSKLADVDVIACGSTPLHFALTRRSVRADIVSLLLNAGADWSRRTLKNQSPLSATLGLPIRTCLNMLILLHGHRDKKPATDVAAIRNILTTAGILSTKTGDMVKAYHIPSILESQERVVEIGWVICEQMATLFDRMLSLDTIVEGFASFRS